MSEQISQKKKIDRIEITQESADLLANLHKQVEERCPEVALSRKDLANWILQNRPPHLTDNDLKDIKKDFFDSVSYLKSLVKKAEMAKLMGETYTLPALQIFSEKTKRIRKKKESTISDIENPISAEKA